MTLFRRFLALVLALALAAAAALVIIEAVGIRTGGSPVLLPVDDWAERLGADDRGGWASSAWTIASAGTLAAGVVLILLQLVPHRTTTLDRRGAGDEGPVRFGRSGLDQRLKQIVIDQDGVIGGRVGVSRRKVKVTAEVPTGSDRTVAKRTVADAVRHDLEHLRLARTPRVRTDTVAADSRVN